MLQFPSMAVPAFECIAKLNDDGWKKLQEVIDEKKIPTKPSEIEIQIAKADIENVDGTMAKQIVALVMGLRSAADEMGYGVDRIVDGILPALKTMHKNIALDTKEEKSLGERLRFLLAAKNALAMAARIRNVSLDTANSFIGARILTDVRPVFTEAVDDSPAVLVIQHALKLAYADDQGNQRVFYTVLDNDALDVLSKAIERAKTKATSLTKTLKQTKIPLLYGESKTQND